MHLLIKYFSDLTDKQIGQFKKAGELYHYWNKRINVISRKDIDNLYLNHTLHSLSIAKVILFRKGTTVLDVGTGGGFPGIPLAILMPGVFFTLVDSTGKKIRVVNEIKGELGLENVTALHSRAEDLKGQYDFIVSRAVCKFPEFVKMTRGLLKPGGKNSIANGILYLKGGDIRNEISLFEGKVKIFSISCFFSEDFFDKKKIIYLPAD